MSYKAVHILCDRKVEETISFLLQEAGFMGSTYENGRLIAYCETSLFNLDELNEILVNFDLVAEQITEEQDQNWNEVWEKNFKDADVGPNIHVRAPFHPAKKVKHDIIILPKMAFGTGHHETTQLSAISLDKLDCTDKAVLDMGCGSGVLAILASQKGAKRILAIDYDEKCIENTTENVQLNGITNVEIEQANNIAHLNETFDIIVSNIVKNINLSLLSQFVSKLNHGGTLILCGFMEPDLKEQVDAAMAHDLVLIEQNVDNNWLQTRYVIAK